MVTGADPRGGGGVHCYGLQFILSKSPCFWTTEGLLKQINVQFGRQLVLATPD